VARPAEHLADSLSKGDSVVGWVVGGCGRPGSARAPGPRRGPGSGPRKGGRSRGRRRDERRSAREEEPDELARSSMWSWSGVASSPTPARRGRRLALHDEHTIQSLPRHPPQRRQGCKAGRQGPNPSPAGRPGRRRRELCLLRLGRGAALAADATVDEIVGILIAVAPITGLARVVAAATPAVARSVGHDRDGRFRHCIASCAIDREGSGNQERPSQAYLASRPISCTRWTAWPRELAPSLR
jgi:hypothetical protein